MRITIAQMEVEPGQPLQNLQRALSLLEKAQDQGSQLLVLPEMALPGYLLGDLWERPSFLRETLEAQGELIAASRGGVAIAFGGLGVDEHLRNKDGRLRKYISFYLAQNGQLCPPERGPYNYSIKTLHPNYREFDDSRHFIDLPTLALEEGVHLRELLSPHILRLDDRVYRIGCILCEDGWNDNYTIDPCRILGDQKIDLLINTSSSPFTRGKTPRRDRMFKAQAPKVHCPQIYCNATGIQNNGKNIYAFDGDSCVYNLEGQRVLELPLFEEGLLHVDLQTLPEPKPSVPPQSDTAILHKAIVYGTKKFLQQTQISKVVIGASGGIDSALVAAIYRQILAPEQLVLINMPSRFNTHTTRSAAEELAHRLGCLYGIVGIEDSVRGTMAQLDGLTLRSPHGQQHTLHLSPFVLENVQARDRSGRILAAIAAATGGAFTCNANKSETTVGYSTLYGDHAGFLANIADLWKGQVYDLARYINEGHDFIPQSILDVKPSAELSDLQNPEQGQGDPFYYPYHDALFRSWVEYWHRASPEEILEAQLNGRLGEFLNIEEDLIHRRFPNIADFIQDLERWWTCYCGMGLAKRIQNPPILSVSRRAFGFDHRESQTKTLWTRHYKALKDKALGN